MKKQIIALIALVLSAASIKAQDDAKLKPLQRDYKWGYAYDANNGVFTIPPKYDDALYFEEGLAPVKLNDKWGYINEQGATVIPFKFDYANIFTDGYATVGKAGGKDYIYGLINKAGVLVIPMKYDGIGDVSEGLISVIVGNKLGFINIKGVQVIPMKFDVGPTGQLSDFSGGYAKIQFGKKIEFIDKTGKEICAPKYTMAGDFKEGMVQVGVDTNWNKKTSDGSKITSAWGFIDATGKEVIPCQYENVSSFEDGFAKAYLDGNILKIDKTGKVVDTIQRAPRRRIIAYDSSTYSGKINKMGRLTILYNGGFIKSVTLNDKPVYNTSRTPIDVDAKKMGFRPGSSATLKIIYTKGTSVKLLAGQGIE
jgi:hypothetical protein